MTKPKQPEELGDIEGVIEAAQEYVAEQAKIKALSDAMMQIARDSREAEEKRLRSERAKAAWRSRKQRQNSTSSTNPSM